MNTPLRSRQLIGRTGLVGAILIAGALSGCAPILLDRTALDPTDGADTALHPDLAAAESRIESGDYEGAAAALDHWFWFTGGTDSGTATAVRLGSLLDALYRLEHETESIAGVPWWTRSALDRPEVQTWKRTFQAGEGRSLRRWTERAARYLPEMQPIIAEEQMPPEIWVLTVVESGLRHDARSRANALGLWQFVAPTARHSGLLVTVDRDERRDWEASTRGACRYLKELHEIFDDGLLALAAFNCGPARVRRAMAKSESRSFWDLDLPRETREYVPRILALVDLLGDGSGAEFPVAADGAPVYETVQLPHPVEVGQLARRCGSPVTRLQELNPSWLRPVTPGDGHPVIARVPAGAAEAVRTALAEGSLREVKLTPAGLHRIRRGDTLWDISRHYRVSLDSLLLVNGMTGKEVIRPGRTLRIPG